MKNHIVLISDDNYVLPTAVCIQSIIDNALDNTENFVIHVCTMGLTKENTKKLLALSKSACEIRIDVFDKEKDALDLKIGKITQKTHVSPSALIKFELANHFFTIDKLLYLDSDIIIKAPINKLFTIDIENYYLAASMEMWKYVQNLWYTPNNKLEFYFNSGVMLLNLKEMRLNKVSDLLWDYKINHAKSKLMDQESFNEVCKNAVKPISIKWNFNPLFNKPHYLKIINKAFEENYNSLNELLKDVKIIHYVGKTDKPWIYRTAQMREFWQCYYEKIEWLEELNLIEETYTQKKSFIKKIITTFRDKGVIKTFNYIKYWIYVKTCK